MQVARLIELLADMDPDADVFVCDRTLGDRTWDAMLDGVNYNGIGQVFLEATGAPSDEAHERIETEASVEMLGRHRTWRIVPREGSREDDRWTLLGSPIPSPGNPAAPYDDGQFPTLTDARIAMHTAEAVDDGTHLED